MTSLCTQFWQVVLAQGIGMGIGSGIIFLPSISIISHYFMKRRALAMGICTTGSSTGGMQIHHPADV
jgi:MFS family permease